MLCRPDGPEVVIRDRGPRELDELPADEVAARARLLCEDDQEVLKRKLLAHLGWVRLTPKVSEYLCRCIDLMREMETDGLGDGDEPADCGIETEN